MKRFFSLITPVYNRPDEVQELLTSLARQSYTQFEVILIEDGSTKPATEIVKQFKDKLNIRYYQQPKAGPSAQRNFGFSVATGDYFILVDSDCILPESYFESLNTSLTQTPLDCFGGPDAAHPDFNPLQKAISFTMTSLLTTGGIRGKKKHTGKFTPRSFNMGFRKGVYETVGGFIDMHPGEDIDLSLRIIKAGFQTGLIPEIYVWHKRRNSLKSFYRQMYRFGKVRVELAKLHRGQLQLVHLFPLMFMLYTISCLTFAPVLGLFFWWLPLVWITPLVLYTVTIFLLATLQNRSLKVGLLSVVTTYIQMFAYGTGLLSSMWRLWVKGEKTLTKAKP